MLKFDKFDVEFDSNRNVFFAGQVVSGRILCHVSEPVNIRGIKLKINGSANVEWSEKTNDGYRTYSNSEQYFVYKKTLFGHQGGGEKTELGAGQHAFEFSTQLPTDLPSSFEGHHGSVRYYVRATSDGPKSDISCQRMFSVNAIADLNIIEGANARIEKEKEKFICCLCCESGPISARCWLDHQGFVPGENIPFSAEIQNKSNAGSVSSSIRLIQSIVYHANAKQRTIDTVISQAQRPSFRGREDYWSGFRLAIPALPPSPFKSCKIITIDYYIQFTVDPGLFSVSQKLRLPIMIGTVPLRIEGQFSRFKKPAIERPTLATPDGYDDLPLPSFDAYPFGAVHAPESGIESTKDALINVLGFKPNYILYQSADSP